MLLVLNFFFFSIPFRQEQHLEFRAFKYNLKSSTTLGTGGISQPPWGRWRLSLCGVHLVKVQDVRLCIPEFCGAAMEGCAKGVLLSRVSPASCQSWAKSKLCVQVGGDRPAALCCSLSRRHETRGASVPGSTWAPTVARSPYGTGQEIGEQKPRNSCVEIKTV